MSDRYLDVSSRRFASKYPTIPQDTAAGEVSSRDTPQRHIAAENTILYPKKALVLHTNLHSTDIPFWYH